MGDDREADEAVAAEVADLLAVLDRAVPGETSNYHAAVRKVLADTAFELAWVVAATESVTNALVSVAHAAVTIDGVDMPVDAAADLDLNTLLAFAERSVGRGERDSDYTPGSFSPLRAFAESLAIRRGGAEAQVGAARLAVLVRIRTGPDAVIPPVFGDTAL